MRLPVLFFISLFTTNLQAQTQQFDASEYIKKCLDKTASFAEQQACTGFFYGIASKTNDLINPQVRENVLQRAMTTRMSGDNYSKTKRRQLGINQVCLPANLTLNDFKSTIISFQENTKKQVISVIDVADLFAQTFSCGTLISSKE